MTPEEKAKLYDAIDYDENAIPVDFPKEYVAHKLNFCMQRLTASVFYDDFGGKGNQPVRQHVLTSVLHELYSSVDHRPGAGGLK